VQNLNQITRLFFKNDDTPIEADDVDKGLDSFWPTSLFFVPPLLPKGVPTEHLETISANSEVESRLGNVKPVSFRGRREQQGRLQAWLHRRKLRQYHLLTLRCLVLQVRVALWQSHRCVRVQRQKSLRHEVCLRRWWG